MDAWVTSWDVGTEARPCDITDLQLKGQHLQSSMGHKAAGSGNQKLAQQRQHGSITWDITLSRPIQHCEGHNRQGWPFTHRLPLCPTNGLCASMQSNKTNTTGATEILAGDWWFKLQGSRLFPSARTPPLYEYQFSVYLKMSLSQRVISSQSVWAQLIISQTDVWEMVTE